MAVGAVAANEVVPWWSIYAATGTSSVNQGPVDWGTSNVGTGKTDWFSDTTIGGNPAGVYLPQIQGWYLWTWRVTLAVQLGTGSGNYFQTWLATSSDGTTYTQAGLGRVERGATVSQTDSRGQYLGYANGSTHRFAVYVDCAVTPGAPVTGYHSYWQVCFLGRGGAT